MVGKIELITKYFDNLSSTQESQLSRLYDLYIEWNQKINVISRKDIDQLYLRHVLHSLAISKYISFRPDTSVLDLGTGGGFPGIPLAILHPEANFLMIDGRSKKIKVVSAVIETLSLRNAKALPKRSEDIKMKFDFVTARAVTRLDKLIPLSLRLVHEKHRNAIPNGLLALKGGTLGEEIKEVEKQHHIESKAISDYFEEDYFDQKYILYIQV